MSAYLQLASGAIVVSFGAALGVGAIAGGTTAVVLDGTLGTIVGLFAGAAAGAAFMGLVAVITWRMSGFVLALGTLGVAELTRVVVQNQAVLGGALGFRIDAPQAGMWWPVGIAVLAMLAVARLERTPLRAAMSFCRDNPTAALTLGIDPAGVRMVTMLIGGALSGSAGVLLIQNVGIVDPQLFGLEHGIQILLFAIAGGTSTWLGPVLAGVTLTLIPEALRFSTTNRMLLYGAVLVAIVVLRPEGLWQFRRRVEERAA
jgi:branched-chain amino acid transport system permease protein